MTKKRRLEAWPILEKMLVELGENIKLARLRRKIPVRVICDMTGMGRNTLWMIEKGGPNVSIGAYAEVLFTLGLEKDLLKLASDDTLGRSLQDISLMNKKRGPKRNYL